MIDRPTKDCDVLEPRLPAEIVGAAKAFAAEQRQQGEPLDDHWLNDDPSSLANALPEGWRATLDTIFEGKALRLVTLGREDLLRSKLFALCDRGVDLADCLAMAPTSDELNALLPWLKNQDANPDWPAHVCENIAMLARKLGHGV